LGEHKYKRGSENGANVKEKGRKSKERAKIKLKVPKREIFDGAFLHKTSLTRL
jgi:hypothetical protein